MKRHADIVGAGRNGYSQLEGGARQRSGQLDRLPVNGNLELVLLPDPTDVAQPDSKVVVRVERENVGHKHPTPRAERKPDGPVMLLLVLSRPKGLGERRRWRATDRESADHS